MKRTFLPLALVAAIAVSGIAVPAVAQQAAPSATTPPTATSPAAARPASGPVSGPALPGAPRRAAAAPAGVGEVAKRAPINGVLVLYGNERCPTNDNGDEIVICEYRSAQEQYRLPKELREFQVTPENASWAAKAQGVIDEGVGVNATGSCSTSGVGGQNGCGSQQFDAYRRERAARKAEAARVP